MQSASHGDGSSKIDEKTISSPVKLTDEEVNRYSTDLIKTLEKNQPDEFKRIMSLIPYNDYNLTEILTKRIAKNWNLLMTAFHNCDDKFATLVIQSFSPAALNASVL